MEGDVAGSVLVLGELGCLSRVPIQGCPSRGAHPGMSNQMCLSKGAGPGMLTQGCLPRVPIQGGHSGVPS